MDGAGEVSLVNPRLFTDGSVGADACEVVPGAVSQQITFSDCIAAGQTTTSAFTALNLNRICAVSIVGEADA